MPTTSLHPLTSSFSQRLWHRRLLKCIYVRQEIIEQLDISAGVGVRAAKDGDKVVDRIAVSVHEAFEDWTDSQESEVPRRLIDQAARHTYKGFQESTGPLS